ncbi:MAG: pyridoxal-phosphate-dependent aminotransferase family protein [bacterium]
MTADEKQNDDFNIIYKNLHKHRLMTPGPTMVPERVVQAMNNAIRHHKSEYFSKIFEEVIDGLKKIFKTKGDILIFTSSGTGMLEASVQNLFSAGDRVLVVNTGHFGERWANICQAYGLTVRVLEVEWGSAVNPKLIEQRLSEETGRDIKGVFVTHTETSTGIENDIEEIGKIVRETDALLLVDTVSGLATSKFEMDEWGVDVALSASQKGFMCPPGLGFSAISERAWLANKKATLPRYYFDFAISKDNIIIDLQTPWTPAITIIYGLNEAIKMILEEGLENVWERHNKLARATRAGITSMNLTLFPINHAPNVTVVNCPDGFSPSQIKKQMYDRFGIYIAGGQGRLKDLIFRIGHMGYVDRIDILSVIASLEIVLKEGGHIFDSGAGIRSAMDVLSGN